MSSGSSMYRDNAGNLYTPEQVHTDEKTGKVYTSVDCATELRPADDFSKPGDTPPDAVEYGESVGGKGETTDSKTQLPGDK